MKVIKVTPRGYCKGVTRAIAMAKKTVEEYPDKEIYVLGMLVHNRYVIEALEKLNIKTIDDKKKTRLALLDELPANAVVIFTAHGVAPQVKEKAEALGLIAVDASCPDVMKTQEIVQQRLRQGLEILYIGKQHHPEAEAILSLSNHVHLISSKENIAALPSYDAVFVTNQTTMSIFDVEELFQQIQERYPKAVFSEEICNATRIRQEAIAQLHHEDVDVLYVVGDRYSNNSNRLAQIAREQGISAVYLIDDVNGIEDRQLQSVQTVAVTAGASTPTYLTNQVITYLQDYIPDSIKPKTRIDQIL